MTEQPDSALRPPAHDRGSISEQESDLLLRLSERLLTQQRYRQACSILELLVVERPDFPLAAKLLEQTQALMTEDVEAQQIRDSLSEQARRDAIDASHYLGLAALFSERGEQSSALECVEMAKEKGRALPYPYKLQGRMLLRQKDYEGAAREFYKARRFNPFDRNVAENLGKVEYERKNFVEALEHTVDAFLLLPDDSSEAASRLRRRVKTLRRVLGWENRQLIRLFHDRQERLRTAFDRLRWRRDLFLEQQGLIERGLFSGREDFNAVGNRIALAGRLRQVPLWSHLADEAIFQLTGVIHEEFKDTGSVLFGHGSEEQDLYILERGSVQLRRPTPYGSIDMRKVEVRDFFGEINFADPGRRPVEAIALEPSHLMRIEREALDELIEKSPDMGVQVYFSIWQKLATGLRHTNDKLKRFFPSEPQALPESLDPVNVTAQTIEVGPQDKVRLFREQGLSRRELLTLATFSKERHYPAGTYLFREGDPGREMYVVLDGTVRISKFIPGGGEEALAILRRGDFFGEIALVDGQPRSADARTHRGPATVLALHQSTVKDVLTMDPHAALEFLRLLCRILAAREREIEEKVVLWEILDRHDDDPLPHREQGA